MIELEVMAEADGTFSLWKFGREVGLLRLYETDHIDEVTSSSCVIIRRGHIEPDLRDKHLAFKRRSHR